MTSDKRQSCKIAPVKDKGNILKAALFRGRRFFPGRGAMVGFGFVVLIPLVGRGRDGVVIATSV